MEKRTHPRIPLKDLSVDASDGVGFFHGDVVDASRFGVCLTDFPKKLDVHVKKITVVINGRGKNFKMYVKPRWYSIDGLNTSIGAEIMNPSWDWTEFIMNFEPKSDNDVWDAAR
ncbi:MAG: hypothetical protein VR65_03095 [Desulfobulbaceae bacterium BRH_c16a]|nr:MAG: hypothetical protein VR65_03095 [Desulfobulbaceae bacterium BRH_c16a]